LQQEIQQEKTTLEQKYTALLQEQREEYEQKIRQLRDTTTGSTVATKPLALPASTATPNDDDRAEQQEEDGPMNMT
jgi:hypothetical protein